MSETPSDPSQEGQGETPDNRPMMRVLSQYLKDLSFENPGAPQSLRADLPSPNVEVAVDVNARRIADDQYEVELACSVIAKRGDDTAFLVETNYAGLFLIRNVPDQQIEMLLLIEAPRLLFPFARQIVATATRDGGLQPLMLEPLDFAAMYNMQKQQAQGSTQPPAGGDTV